MQADASQIIASLRHAKGGVPWTELTFGTRDSYLYALQSPIPNLTRSGSIGAFDDAVSRVCRKQIPT